MHTFFFLFFVVHAPSVLNDIWLSGSIWGSAYIQLDTDAVESARDDVSEYSVSKIIGYQ